MIPQARDYAGIRLPDKPKGKALCRQFGFEPTRSSIIFGGPEDITPLPSVPKGHSEESTRSSFELRGPESFSHSYLLQQAAEMQRRPHRLHAQLRNVETMHLDVAELRPKAYAKPPVTEGYELTDAFGIDHLPRNQYRDLRGRVTNRSRHAGKAQQSVVGGEMVWEHAPSHVGASLNVPNPKRTVVDNVNYRSVIGGLIFPGAKPTHTIAEKPRGLKHFHGVAASQDHLGAHGQLSDPNLPSQKTYLDDTMRRHYGNDATEDQVVLQGDLPGAGELPQHVQGDYPPHPRSYAPPPPGYQPQHPQSSYYSGLYDPNPPASAPTNQTWRQMQIARDGGMERQY